MSEKKITRTNHVSLFERESDWSKVLTNAEFEELKNVMAKYGCTVTIERHS